MSRLPDVTIETLAPVARAALERLRAELPGVGTRGTFGIWLRCPEMGAAIADMFGAAYRHRTLDRRLFELMTLVAAAHWHASFAWAEHAGRAVNLGIAPSVVDAIRLGKAPRFEKSDEQAVYDVAISLLRTAALDDDVFSRAHSVLGEAPLIELVIQIGLYALVCVTLTAFAVPARESGSFFEDVGRVDK